LLRAAISPAVVSVSNADRPPPPAAAAVLLPLLSKSEEVFSVLLVKFG
jgi:hypothetical protein